MRRILTVFAFSLVLTSCSPAPERTPPGIASSSIPQTTDERFDRDVVDSDKPVLVDFYATWCPACSRMEPVLSEIADRYKGKVKVVRIDVDKNTSIAERYRVNAIPRLMLFRNGDLVGDMLGTTTAERLSHQLDSSLASRSGNTL